MRLAIVWARCHCEKNAGYGSLELTGFQFSYNFADTEMFGADVLAPMKVLNTSQYQSFADLAVCFLESCNEEVSQKKHMERDM